MFKPIISLLLALGLSAPASADTLALREDAPQRYVVKKGDTLWDISARYLKSPWKWPQLWRLNREEIKNPHLIYPGETLVLDMIDGEPVLRREGSRVVKLSPQIRTQQLDAAISTIPAKMIEPFLKRPLLLDDLSSYNSAPRIIAGQDNRVILSTTDVAYGQGLDAGGTWQAYRLGRTITDPDTKEVLGHEVTYGGELTVSKLDTISTLKVGKVAEEVLVGDRLMKTSQFTVMQYAPHQAPATLEGRVVSAYNGVNEIGQNYNVMINRGLRDGVEIGHVFGIYRAPRSVQIAPKQHAVLPTQQVGRLIVYRVFNKASYALVVDASQPVIVGDRIAQPE